MSGIDLLERDGSAEQIILTRLNNREQLQRARIHPFNLLVALKTYSSGSGIKGKLTWPVNEKIADALDKAFYLSFKFVKPTNQRYLLALDVSGSMSSGFIHGAAPITPAVGSCSMCMVTLRTEAFAKVVAFSTELVPVTITADETLDQVTQKTQAITMGGTDCALPMIWAIDRKEDIDVFVVYTDNETWFGKIHPTEALKNYRSKMNKPNAKLIVVGMTATKFSIADPQDKGMLDIAGFDSAAPQLMSLFAEGEI
jgi:60 kDa SS-A/Ro ribonucleoprotein